MSTPESERVFLPFFTMAGTGAPFIVETGGCNLTMHVSTNTEWFKVLFVLKLIKNL